MTRKQREIFNYLEKFKRMVQNHIYFSPLALSNFHHLSDRLLDKRDGNFKNFKKNIKEMLKNGVSPIGDFGEEIIFRLDWFVRNGKSANQFFKLFELAGRGVYYG